MSEEDIVDLVNTLSEIPLRATRYKAPAAVENSASPSVAAPRARAAV